MRFLLVMAVVANSLSAVSLANTAPVAGYVVSFYSNPLLPSVHQLVASGFTLYSARLPTIYKKVDDLAEQAIAVQGHLLVSPDGLIDGLTVCCQANYVADPTTALRAVGVFSQESGRVSADNLVVANNFDLSGTVALLIDGYNLKFADDLLRLSSSKDGLEISLGFERSNHYRVYRGQREVDNGDGTPVVVTETITINGYNPYVVYRHTSWQTDGDLTNSELSIGRYSMLALNPLKVDAKVIQTEQQSLAANPRPVSTDVTYFFGDNTLKEYNDEGEIAWTVDLQLIADSDVWLQYEGNIGITGSGVETLLIDQLRRRGDDKAARIAEELAGALR